MSDQNELRIEEVILCGEGCGRIAGESGFCWKCERGIVPHGLEVDADGVTRMRALWDFEAHRRPIARLIQFRTHKKPYMPDWMYWLLTSFTVALCGWIVFKIDVMFADWLASGGSPWQ